MCSFEQVLSIKHLCFKYTLHTMNQRKILDWKSKITTGKSFFYFFTWIQQAAHDLKYIFFKIVNYGFSNSLFFKGKHESLDLQSHRSYSGEGKQTERKKKNIQNLDYTEKLKARFHLNPRVSKS